MTLAALTAPPRRGCSSGDSRSTAVAARRPNLHLLPMSPLSVALVVAVVLVAALRTRVWLPSRQIRHVAAHRGAVRPPFAATVTLPAHQRAADYTLAKGQFGIGWTAFATALLLGWTWLGGLGALNAVLVGALNPRWGGLAYQIVLVAAFALIGGVLELPFSIYQTFGIEQRFARPFRSSQLRLTT